ncbi:MAG: metallophosphoesterase, partial [Acetobacteraceae bacterium]
RWTGRLAKRLGIPGVLIAGNHEHYDTLGRPGATFGQTLAELHAEAARSSGQIKFLECESIAIAGVRFLGCTLWTDFALYGDAEFAATHAHAWMTDFEVIANRAGHRFTPTDACNEFVAAWKFLEEELANSFEGPTVVVTHHAPSLNSVPPRFRTDLLSAAYASNVDDLVARSSAALWIHGHIHDSCDYTLGKTRVLCNPRGYHGIELNPRFDPRLVVEVGTRGQ